MEITNKEQAQQSVNRFLKRFDDSYKDLLCYSALPLVLTPELLHYIRNSFLRGKVNWIAEVDLLLSDLCHKVGYELYAMDTNVRAYLIGEMEKNFGQQQMQQVASLLIKYLKYLSQNNVINQSQLQYQRWGALVYLDKEKQKVANEIAESFANHLKPIVNNTEINLDIVNKDELYQLSIIAKEFAPQLKRYPEIIKYAETIYDLLKSPTNTEQVAQLKNIGLSLAGDFPNKWIKKVALINLDTSHVFLSTIAKAANQAQSYYQFQVANISINKEKYTIESRYASESAQTVLTSLVEDVQDLPKKLEVDLVCLLTENLIAVEESGIIYSNFFCARIDEQCFAISTYDFSEHAEKANSNLPKAILFVTLGMLVSMESKGAINYHDEVVGCLFDKCIEHASIVEGLRKMKFEHEECRRKVQNPFQLQAIDKLLAIDLSFIFEYETVKVDKKGKIVERHKKEGKQYIEDLGNGVVLEMVEIPSGEFMMGSPDGEGYDSEKPQHKVTVPTFYMGKYQVTQEQWEAVMGSNPSRFKGSGKLPVEQVSWDDVIEFCKRLSEKTNKIYRLPSQAEWEYACRAGIETPFAFGETINTDIVNYDGNRPYGEGAKGEDRDKTTVVGSLGVANEFGLYDMHGNVWEWCQDTWHDNYEGAPTDGSVWNDKLSNKTRRMLRGGSWYDDASYCRSAYRYYSTPDNRDYSWGFRLVLVT